MTWTPATTLPAIAANYMRSVGDNVPIPKPGSRWLHKSGAVYTVALVTNLASTRPQEYPVTVVYSSDDGVVWSRPVDRWHGSMTLLSAASEAAPQPVEQRAHGRSEEQT